MSGESFVKIFSAEKRREEDFQTYIPAMLAGLPSSNFRSLLLRRKQVPAWKSL